MNTPYDINEFTKCKVFQEHQEELHPLKSKGLWWKELEVQPSEISAKSSHEELLNNLEELEHDDLNKLWGQLKWRAFGMRYDIGVGLCVVGNKLKEMSNTITQAVYGFLSNFYGKTEEKKVEELEMKELNREYKPFKTPLIHPEARKISDAHSSDQVVVTRHISQGRQQG